MVLEISVFMFSTVLTKKTETTKTTTTSSSSSSTSTTAGGGGGEKGGGNSSASTNSITTVGSCGVLGGGSNSSSGGGGGGGANGGRVLRRTLSKSPSLQRRQEVTGLKIEAGVAGSRSGGVGAGSGSGVGAGSGNWLTTTSGLPSSPVPISSDEASLPGAGGMEDSDCMDAGPCWENGKCETLTSVTYSDEGSLEGQGSECGDTHKTRAAIEHLKAKIEKTKELIRKEQTHKETNVNEYLHLAASADKQQNQRIKTVFEKRNQKSAHSINHLQKKLEQYQRRLQEVETRGLPGHKQAKEVLRDVGQGLNTIVSKPKEFAHLLKNRFGSADNIAEMKMDDALEEAYTQQAGQRSRTLPVRYASFKLSDDDNSSITSGSGYGGGGGMLLSSPHSTTNQDALAHPHPHPHNYPLPVVTQVVLEPLCEDMSLVKESNQRVEDSLTRLLEEFENYKAITRSEMSFLRGLLEEEKFHVERLEEQLNDLTELHQHEMVNLKQDMASMEEKIEYRLDDRTTDLSDLVDNCQSRIARMEQQQQQQQLVSMEMVENVKFQTLITKLINVVLAVLAVVLVFLSTAGHLIAPFVNSSKLINVVLAVLAVVLVFLSTAGHLIAPFVNSRKRMVWTSMLVLVVALLWLYSQSLVDSLSYLIHTLSPSSSSASSTLCNDVRYSLCNGVRYSLCNGVRYSLCNGVCYSLCNDVRYSLCNGVRYTGVHYSHSLCNGVCYSL
ncbi:hypothetical protein ACOMHN_053874 [Nucella lapillus]